MITQEYARWRYNINFQSEIFQRIYAKLLEIADIKMENKDLN